MLERPHVEALFSLCRGDDPSAQTHLPGTRAFRRYDRLVITGQPMQAVPEPVQLWLHQPVTFGPWELKLTDRPGEGMAVPACELPLTVRSRRTGDAISMAYGRKSVKKLLIERKIPKDLRDTVPILCNNETILAVGDLCAAQLPGDNNFYIICRRKEI
jgi:tRNA(Ile)-lysidine synthase